LVRKFLLLDQKWWRHVWHGGTHEAIHTLLYITRAVTRWHH